MTEYPDYIGREAVRRLDEPGITDPREAAVDALCQLLMETGFKEPEPRDLVMARRMLQALPSRAMLLDNEEVATIADLRALLREYAGEEA